MAESTRNPGHKAVGAAGSASGASFGTFLALILFPDRPELIVPLAGMAAGAAPVVESFIRDRMHSAGKHA